MARKYSIFNKDQQAAYGQTVLSWAEQAMRYFSHDNWQRQAAGWICRKQYPPPPAIEHSSGAISISFDLRALDQQLLFNSRSDALRKVRSKVLKIAQGMLAEATAADRKQLQRLKQEATADVSA